MQAEATLNHSCSHLLAAAIKRLYPKVKFAIGPAIENGFYYDFEFSQPVSEADFGKIEKTMGKIKQQACPFERKVVSLAEAKKLFANQPYKLEILKELKGKISVYQTGDFVDLCKGPHVVDTAKIGAFKLLSIAGAYWRGSEQNKMLTRLYGICFPTAKELAEFLRQRAEAAKRDHRKIGQELELFSFHPEAPGDVFWHPKGYLIMQQLFEYWRELHRREGYQEVRTPEILTRQVWNQSGHTDFFMEKIYRVLTPGAKQWDMAIKPMNCDGGILIYQSKLHSYREFPLRLGELGVVHRFESGGEIHGLLRLREFTQDDAHIFCTPAQVKSELKKVIALCFEFYDTFGLKLDHLELSTRPAQSIGATAIWEKAEGIMRQVLQENQLPHQVNEGEGAFYGPKFDFHLRDSLGRTWQCATIQLDFAQPENFDLEYVTAKGTRERPVLIHRVIYGSVERFLGILIEQYAGAFPVWLAPVQAKIIPITDQHLGYGRQVYQKLVDAGLRTELDDRRDTTAAKIRAAELQKIPYLLVVGDREIANGHVNVRTRGKKVLGEMTTAAFLTRIKADLAQKRQI